MPSIFAAVTTSQREGGVTLELVTRRWGVTPKGVEEERVGRKGKPGQAQGSGKGDGIGDGIGRREKEGASEEVG